ncbi:MAG: hypothetical protein ABS92_00100 [Thiobacillus sp. SCN 63-374]|nr:MAG: hypothetical protein ABS92_00100 [Thiobacillus sp. SCN 63-374]
MAYGPPPECPETEPHYCLVRQGVYEKLLKVQQSLPDGYLLRLYEGLRSLGVQALLFHQETERVRARRPNLSTKEVHAEACRLVSPVQHWDGAENTPPHCTGGAVDVEIIDEQGHVIDFGMQIKDWFVVPPELCAPQCASISEGAARNRDLLRQVMLQQGFAPYQHEWWHFSYGDQAWANHFDEPHSLYDACSSKMISTAYAASALTRNESRSA